MWVSFIRAGFGMGVLGLMMFVLAMILEPIVGHATSGPNADAETVTQIGGWFNVLTVDNLTLIAGLAVGLFLVHRAVVERQVGP
jgi:hypothetical protein